MSQNEITRASLKTDLTALDLPALERLELEMRGTLNQIQIRLNSVHEETPGYFGLTLAEDALIDHIEEIETEIKSREEA